MNWSFPSFILLLIGLGLVFWYGTAFFYDLFSKMFTPIEPEKPPLNEKPPRQQGYLITEDLDSGYAIVRDPYTYEDHLVPITGDITYVRGGRGNTRLIEFSSYEKEEKM